MSSVTCHTEGPSADHAIRNGVLSLIGHTPLVRLRRVCSDLDGVELYAKVEAFNPGGSVKDRPALGMVEDAERTGALKPGKAILDATSGNTGIALAMIGAAKGYPVKLAMPANASLERRRLLQALGADLVLTDPLEGTDGAIRTARALYAAQPELYCYVDQYNNPANWLAHYNSTGLEVWRQTKGRVTHFVAGLGTGGTLMGTGRRLREYNPDIRLIAVQPDAPLHGIEGLKHMASSIVPGIYDPHLQDEELVVSTEDAYEMVRRLAREEGLLVGVSSGAAAIAALSVARRLTAAVVVTIFPDGAYRYLSERFWGPDVDIGQQPGGRDQPPR